MLKNSGSHKDDSFFDNTIYLSSNDEKYGEISEIPSSAEQNSNTQAPLVNQNLSNLFEMNTDSKQYKPMELPQIIIAGASLKKDLKRWSNVELESLTSVKNNCVENIEIKTQDLEFTAIRPKFTLAQITKPPSPHSAGNLAN